MADFFAMGGYAFFVWFSYGISALVLGGAVVLTLGAYRQVRDSLERLERSAD